MTPPPTERRQTAHQGRETTLRPGTRGVSQEPEKIFEPEEDLRLRRRNGSTSRPRNELWDALTEIFGDATTVTAQSRRGKIIRSLKAARASPDEIISRARSWPLHFDIATLTETALEKHWDTLGRPTTQEEIVNAFEFDEKPEPRTNQAAATTDCAACGGDRFVLYSTRPVQASTWMVEKGIKPPADAAIEEYAPCPLCNAGVDASHWAGGRKVTPPDPAQVRERLGR